MVLINTRTCLRCQFREVLHRTQFRHSPSIQCRGVTSSSQFCQDTSDDLLRRKKPYYWKHFNDGERVVGKPGKRQRVSSEGLTTTSLGKPANVIVFRDFKEEPSTATPVRILEEQSTAQDDGRQSKTSLSAQDIERAISARHAAPRDEEVHASIDALRPDETILNQRAFDRLQQSLTRSYTFQQLSRYLVESLPDARSTVKSRKVQELKDSQWQPGQTPLQQRRSLVVKKSSASRKAALVEQILRLVWHITIHSEAQEVGELEIKVQPWQLSMLFDLVENGKPYYESLIGSKILLDACDLHTWPADSTLRITGRRQDAEEIARRLKLAMLRGSRLDLDLKVFMPLIMKDAHQDDLGKILSDDNIRYVSSLTKTVIDIRENGMIHVHGLQASARSNARRLLVALLELPGLCSHSETFTGSKKATGRENFLGQHSSLTAAAAHLISGLHRRHKDFELRRLATQLAASEISQSGPTNQAASKNMEGATVQESGHSTTPTEPFAEALSSRLDKLPEPSNIPPEVWRCPASYWREQSHVDTWEAEYCSILSSFSAPDAGSKTSRSKKNKTASQPRSAPAADKSVVQRTVPGTETLLSYLEPTHAQGPRNTFDPRMPYLSAHFVPFAPNVSTTQLPRLEMRFRLLPPTTGQNAGHGLLLTKIKAVLDTQAVAVPLPRCSIDLRFTRDATLLVDSRAARKDQTIDAFVKKLQDSVNAGEGALDVPAQLDFKLPRWLVRAQDAATGKSDVEVPYLLERFEQTQRTVFRAPESRASMSSLDTEVKTSLGALSNNMALDYREIEGGAMYGRQTSLSIRVGHLPQIASTPTREHMLVAGEPHVDTANMTDHDGSSGSTTDLNEQFGRISSDDGVGHELSQSTSDVEGVGQSEELSKATSSSLELATAALHIANLLTRASSGTLQRMGEQK